MPRTFTTTSRTIASKLRGSESADDYGWTSHLSLSLAPRAPSDPRALSRYSARLGRVATKAATYLGSKLESLSVGVDAARLRKFMTGSGALSALDVAPTHWMRLTETQITRPMAEFLNDDGAKRVMAFLRALPCDGVDLPDAFDAAQASAEVAAAGGRVDLLLTGRKGSRTYGAAVEVKIDHKLHNPLGSYARLASEKGIVVAGRDERRATGTLVVLARSSSEATRKRLIRNRGWRFVHWSGFLRRFEQELQNAPDDDEFRAFRRMVWDRFI